MEFRIISRKWANTLKMTVPTIVISITDINSYHPIYSEKENILDILYLKFDDVDLSSNTNPESRFYVPINEIQAKEIVDFVEKYKDKVEQVVCQCDAGISRSSATAAALSVIYNGNGSDKWIFDSRQYVPNTAVYRAILNVKYGAENK